MASATTERLIGVGTRIIFVDITTCGDGVIIKVTIGSARNRQRTELATLRRMHISSLYLVSKFVTTHKI